LVREFAHKNYWALILGGSQGLGLATAKKLAQHGMHICIVHRTRRTDLAQIEREFALIAKEEVELLHYNVDALKGEKRGEVMAALKAHLGEDGKVRALVHSIAKGNLKPMAGEDQPHLSNDDFHLTLEAMAISVYDWTKALLHARLFAVDARVLSFTSEGSSRAWKNYAAVAAAKAALEAITRSMALEFAPSGVRANCILAGVTDTASLRKIPNHETLMHHSRQRNPFRRLTTPQDVANVVYLLCKDEAAWINGAVIPVDGGEHVR